MFKTLWKLGLVLIFSQLQAQDVPKVSNSYLIRGAIVTTHPTSAPSVQDILVKDGIIQAIGPNINPPVIAKVIAVDSMYLYPGFIAPASHIGVSKPKDPSSPPKVARPGYPPNDAAGITPEAQIMDSYDAKKGSIAAMRKLGFTIPHSMWRSF